MPAKPHLRQPRVAPALPSVDLRIDDETRYSESLIEGDFSETEGDSIEIKGSRLNNVHFTGANLSRLKLVDVVVDGADFAGANLEDAVLTRVEFKNCRMSGLLLPNARLRDVSISKSKLDGCNLRMMKAERIEFTHVDLHDADFYSAELIDAWLFDCNLDGVEFSKATLPKARFHGSSLAEIKGASYLKDIVIETTQVTALAFPVFSALDIHIDDQRDPISARRIGDA